MASNDAELMVQERMRKKASYVSWTAKQLWTIFHRVFYGDPKVFARFCVVFLMFFCEFCKDFSGFSAVFFGGRGFIC